MSNGYICLAIDPGVNGAVGWISPFDDAEAIDTPTIKIKTGRKTKSGNAKTKSHYNEREMVNFLKGVLHQRSHYQLPVRAVIEDVHAMPDDSKVGCFTFGESKGIWRGMLAALEIPYEMIPPSEWKPAMVGQGADKEASRAMAQRMFPKVDLTRKKDHNRAETLLMAEYLRRQLCGESHGEPPCAGEPATKRAFSRAKKAKKDKPSPPSGSAEDFISKAVTANTFERTPKHAVLQVLGE